MATTGITLLVLSAIAILYGGKYISVYSVFQSFGVNVVIHLGFLLTGKFESRYPILEAMLDITYTAAIVILAGNWFDWYHSTPIWVLFLMSLLIYAAVYLLNIVRMKEDVKEINTLLRKRKNAVS